VLAISLVSRRESGLLKRLRLSPLPTWVMLAAVFLSSIIVSALQVVLLLAIGRLAYHVTLPHNYLALVVTLVVGALCFCSLGVAASTLVPNQDAAGPLLGILFYVLLFLSGLYYPLKPGSAVARISSLLPVRHFIVAAFAPFDLRAGVSSWAPHDLLVMGIWGVVGVWVSVRRFRWEPHRG
jgi:ABC-2 type transport system permease protein